MDKELYQEYCNKLFSSKNRKEWDNVCVEIKQATENDEQARTALRNYLSKIKDKKFQYFEKYPPKEKKTFPVKNSFIFQDNLAEALAEFIKVLTLEKKLEIQNKYNINLN